MPLSTLAVPIIFGCAFHFWPCLSFLAMPSILAVPFTFGHAFGRFPYLDLTMPLISAMPFIFGHALGYFPFLAVHLIFGHAYTFWLCCK